MNGRHVLGYGSRPAPHLLLADGAGGTEGVPLDGPFDWRFGEVRRCVGSFEEDRHVSCPTGEPLAIHSQCDACSGLEDPACVFEPRCALDPASCHCVSTFKGVPHLVYCAFFGTLPKVGMTQARRFETRLREQGADAGFAIQAHVRGRPGEILDRAAARQVEQSVRFLYGIPEHRSHRETLPQLARPVPWPEIQERSAGWMERLGERFDVLRELVRITDHSIIQPLPSVPRRSTVPGRHHGTWLGAKGQNLIYREGARSDRLDVGGRLVALKASDVVGRIVETAP